MMSIEGNTYKQGSMIADRYIVAELIGQGSLSDVYRCIDVSTQKMVCLKMSNIIEGGKRISNEYKILSLCDIAGVPKVYDLFEYEGNMVFSMEYIEGNTLKCLLDEKRICFDIALRVIGGVTEIITKLHKNDPCILYLDVKPENIIVNKDEVYLIDYGAAVILNEAEEYVRENEVIYGTRGFAAPEQYEKDIGPVIGKRTDIYGIGALLEKMLSYYKNDKSMAGRKHILRECERITQNCTRRVYSRRYADAGEVKSEIINLLNY